MFGKRRSLVSAALLALILPQSACTLLGRAIGTSIDANRGQSFAPEMFPPDTIKPGKTIEIHMRDGGVIRGEYVELGPLRAENYAQLFDAYLSGQAAPLPLPALRDTVMVYMQSGDILQAEFLGFGLDSLWLKATAQPTARGVSLGNIHELRTGDQAAISGGALLALAAVDSLPPLPHLTVKTPGLGWPFPARTKTEHLARIEAITVTPGTARKWGTVIGAVVDVAVMVTVFALTFEPVSLGGMGG